MTDSARNSNAISSEPLWVPSQKQKESALLFDFMGKISKKTGRKFDNYADLWRWSVDFSEAFWDFLWDYCDVQGEKGGRVLDSNGGQMLGARFFPEGQINFAENNLRQRDKQTAIIFRNETGQERSLSYADLYEQVSLWQQAFIREGVREGDRVAAYMPNTPETIIAFLAAASLGAIWSSASPDFGVQGVIDRFGQIEPKILITADGYHYNGKVIDCLPKVKDVQPALKGLKKTVVIPFAGSSLKPEALPDAVGMADFTAGLKPKEVEFKRVDFNHPLFILFSSGTTGVPKCIVHGHGGTLLQHLKEHRLQTNIKPGDKVFYFTTCGWMMWNWLVTGLASGATLLLYDGSPFFSEGRVLWDFTSAHGCTLFGTSAKYIDALKSAGMNPGKTHDLSALRTVTSTGSPLVHESFDYIYKAIKPDVHLASISGGTDIVSCFMLGNPLSPVWRGEIQGPGLGMAVDVFDEEGQPATISAGELVCTKPFPSMPVSFWNDPERVKYKAAYFERFENIWVHGDWVEKTPHGGFIIHGRSDATLNPGGVRIGTAEIYRQVEQIEGVQESIAVGQDWEGDVRVILFVVLKKGWELDENLTKEIKTKIRNGASPRHVPAKIIAVSDIPRTKSGKITELAVRDVIHGRKIKNVEALANPDSLQLYKNLQELQG
ncbi:MAG: acetoacetate--CoA ligase [Alphaproteobacteria bacterium]|nr:acetoacetate--CoA ligase [Alphaproteobacteria bacterium]MCB9975251.1 acetoacetate--CoA ligase [Rhodospirillales bacterium]